MVGADKYFVYPHEAFATNFADPGGHHFVRSTHLQAPLRLHDGFDFSLLNSNSVMYDVFGEYLPHCFKRLAPALKGYGVAIDLYGMKDLSQLENEYVLTSKPGGHSLAGFGLDLKPHELNVVYEL